MIVAVQRSAPRLAQHWPAVEARIARSRHLALFFDFDGTLAPFARRPEQVRVAPQIRRVLGRLARRSGVRVFVISGRRRANLRRHLAIQGIGYLGLYGWETDSIAPRLPPGVRDALGQARGWLAQRQARYPGLWIEDKHVSLSVHLREIPVRVRPLVRRDLGVLSRRLRPAVRLFHNRLDAEFVPSAVGGKGATLARLLAQPELVRRVPDVLRQRPLRRTRVRGHSRRPGRHRWLDGTDACALRDPAAGAGSPIRWCSSRR